ncbi:hypothetical protein F183_A51400 [Bryobacterales bacterium F-183]|nr:hypothetical protein F183_A51400 [Bryobacterales bacterium F-183]
MRKLFGSMSSRLLLGVFALLGGSSAFAQSPTIFVVGPNSATAGSTPTVRIIGVNLVGSVSTDVCYSGPGAPSPTCVSAGSPTSSNFTATLPPIVAGTGSIFVRANYPSFSSNSFTFQFRGNPSSPGPVISSINPTSQVSGSGDFTITGTGSNLAGLQNAFSIRAFTFSGPDTLPGLTSAATTMSATMPSNLSFAPRDRYFYVSKVIDDFIIYSNLVLHPNTGPTLTSTNPSSIVVGSGNTVVNVVGRFATNGAGVTPTDFSFVPPGGTPVYAVGTGTGTTATVTIPAAALTAVGTGQLIASAPDVEGTIATSIDIQIVPPPPNITGVSPTSIWRNTATTGITLTGTNLATVSALTFTPQGGAAINILPQVTSQTATQVVVSLTAGQTATAGTGTFTLSTVNGTTTRTIAVVDPTLTSASPNTLLKSAGPTTITLTGTNFQASGGNISTVRFTAPVTNTVTDFTPASVTATSATFSLPANAIPNAGTGTVRVIGGGAQSGTVNITIVEPTITSTNPTSALQNGATFNLTLNGSNFNTGGTPTVRFTPPGGSATVLTIVGTPTANQVVATVPNTLLTTAGNAIITVQTGNAVSPNYTFAVGSGPTLTNINPTNAPRNSATITNFVLTGTNFTAGGTPTVNWVGPTGSASLTVSASSATSITATIPASLMVTAGTATVSVTTGTSTTGTQTFTITELPSISFIDPPQVFAGGGSFTMFLFGSNFTASGSPSVRFTPPGGSAVTLTPSSATNTNLTVTVPANLITNVGNANVQVLSGANAASLVSTLPILPSPVITSITPTGVQAGTGNTVLTITGSNLTQLSFYLLTRVRFGSTLLTPTSETPTQVVVTVPANLLTTPGVFPVTVEIEQQVGNIAKVPEASRTPLMVGNVSNAVNFTVFGPLTVTSLNPTRVAVGSGNFTLTINGNGFQSGDIVDFNGTNITPSNITSGAITATIPANLISTTGAKAVRVRNSVGTNSNSVNLIADYVLTSLNPPGALQGGPAFPLTVTATTPIAQGASIIFNGSTVTGGTVNGNTITATIPANLIASGGTGAPVTITDGTANSNTLTFNFNTQITLTSVNPDRVEAGTGNTAVTLTGSGFVSGMSLVFNGTSVTTTVNSSTSASATIPSTLLATPGVVPVLLRVGGEVPRDSNTVNFTILTALRLTSLNPSRANSGGSSFTLTATGAGFVPGAIIRFNGVNLSTTFVNSTTLQTVISSALLGLPGNVEVRVLLPDERTSGPQTFTILPALRITSITPAAVAAGANQLTMTVNGEGFVPESVVRLGGLSLLTTFVNANQLTALVSDAALATPNTLDVLVANPGGTESNRVSFAVGGRLTLSAVTPNNAALNSPAIQVTLTGEGFNTSTIARFNSIDLVTTFISSTQLRATIPSDQFRVAGNFPVTVSNGGQPSNSVNFEVGAKPELTFLNPDAITAGARGFTLIVLGRNFQPGATIRFGGENLPTTFVSGSQLSAPVPATLLVTPRTVPVSVANTQGDPSNSLDFRIVNLTLTSLDPPRATAGGAAFTLTLTGTGFISGASASFGSTPVTTSFGSATSLTAQIPASAILNAGTIQVSVANPDGARSNAVPFVVQSNVPSITRLNPNSVVAGSGEVSVAVTGGGFVNGSVVQVNGNGVQTSFGSSSALDAVIPASLTNQIGNLSVRVVNPGNVESNTVNFAVTAPTPAITRVVPGTINAGSSVPVNLAITGTGFVNGSVVQFNGSGIETSFGSSTSLSAVIPVSALATAGNATIRVVNPGDILSNTVQFVIAGDFSLTSVNPTTLVRGGTTNLSIGVSGTGFANGAVVLLGGNELATTFNSATSLTAVVPPALLSAAGTVPVAVRNADGAVSNALNIRVDNPIPVPPLTLTVPAVITPAGNGRVQVVLQGPAPVDLTGTLVITFVNNSNNSPNNYIDPALLFQGNNSRTVSFTIPAGQTTAIIPTDGAFSPGTVAGTIVVTITQLNGGGQNLLPNPAPTRNITVDRAVPVVIPGSVRISNITGGFQVELNGISSPRDLARISYTFSSSSSILEGTTITVEVGPLFQTYFQSQAGLDSGGTFRFVMPFTVSGGEANSVTSVTVVLTNSAGNSTAVTGGR